MRRNGIRGGVHSGKKGPACGLQRFIGFEDNGKLDQIVSTNPDQSSCPGFRGDAAAVCKCISILPKRHQRITGRQVELLFPRSNTPNHHRRKIP